jgi:DNA mismatch repair protein MutS
MNEGIDEEADKEEKNIEEGYQKINKIIEYLGNLVTKGGINMKKEDGTIILYATEARVRNLSKAKIDEQICGKLYYSKYKSEQVSIKSDVIDELVKKIESSKKRLNEIMSEYYNGVIKNISTYSVLFMYINNYVSEIDYTLSNAINVKRYKYYRPDIKECGDSYIRGEEIRHPLVEKIIKTEYITNDIDMKEKKGLLLYGLNSSGKTCFTKAIGLAIIMAQAGMFVAGKIEFSPFRRILTRLTSNDDILKGYSSFAIEMMEINTILVNANSRSLILGDELTRGTESASGTGLTIALLEELNERGSTFIVSSHMHHMPRYIKCKEKIHIKHFKTEYDESKNGLIYERKLLDGQGSNYYGIEVARNFVSNKEYIKRANDIRKEFIEMKNLYLSNKMSRYNSELYLDECFSCGKNKNLQTHHVEEQKNADKEGFIEYYHKNEIFNLMILCQDCHTKLHQENKKYIKKYINGKERIFEIISEKE